MSINVTQLSALDGTSIQQQGFPMQENLVLHQSSADQEGMNSNEQIALLFSELAQLKQQVRQEIFLQQNRTSQNLNRISSLQATSNQIQSSESKVYLHGVNDQIQLLQKQTSDLLDKQQLLSSKFIKQEELNVQFQLQTSNQTQDLARTVRSYQDYQSQVEVTVIQKLNEKIKDTTETVFKQQLKPYQNQLNIFQDQLSTLGNQQVLNMNQQLQQLQQDHQLQYNINESKIGRIDDHLKQLQVDSDRTGGMVTKNIQDARALLETSAKSNESIRADVQMMKTQMSNSQSQMAGEMSSLSEQLNLKYVTLNEATQGLQRDVSQGIKDSATALQKANSAEQQVRTVQMPLQQLQKDFQDGFSAQQCKIDSLENLVQSLVSQNQHYGQQIAELYGKQQLVDEFAEKFLARYNSLDSVVQQFAKAEVEKCLKDQSLAFSNNAFSSRFNSIEQTLTQIQQNYEQSDVQFKQIVEMNVNQVREQLQSQNIKFTDAINTSKLQGDQVIQQVQSDLRRDTEMLVQNQAGDYILRCQALEENQKVMVKQLTNSFRQLSEQYGGFQQNMEQEIKLINQNIIRENAANQEMSKTFILDSKRMQEQILVNQDQVTQLHTELNHGLVENQTLLVRQLEEQLRNLKSDVFNNMSGSFNKGLEQLNQGILQTTQLSEQVRKLQVSFSHETDNIKSQVFSSLSQQLQQKMVEIQNNMTTSDRQLNKKCDTYASQISLIDQIITQVVKDMEKIKTDKNMQKSIFDQLFEKLQQLGQKQSNDHMLQIKEFQKQTLESQSSLNNFQNQIAKQSQKLSQIQTQVAKLQTPNMKTTVSKESLENTLIQMYDKINQIQASQDQYSQFLDYSDKYDENGVFMKMMIDLQNQQKQIYENQNQLALKVVALDSDTGAYVYYKKCAEDVEEKKHELMKIFEKFQQVNKESLNQTRNEFQDYVNQRLGNLQLNIEKANDSVNSVIHKDLPQHISKIQTIIDEEQKQNAVVRNQLVQSFNQVNESMDTKLGVLEQVIRTQRQPQEYEIIKSKVLDMDVKLVKLVNEVQDRKLLDQQKQNFASRDEVSQLSAKYQLIDKQLQDNSSKLTSLQSQQSDCVRDFTTQFNESLKSVIQQSFSSQRDIVSTHKQLIDDNSKSLREIKVQLESVELSQKSDIQSWQNLIHQVKTMEQEMVGYIERTENQYLQQGQNFIAVLEDMNQNSVSTIVVNVQKLFETQALYNTALSKLQNNLEQFKTHVLNNVVNQQVIQPIAQFRRELNQNLQLVQNEILPKMLKDGRSQLDFEFNALKTQQVDAVEQMKQRFQSMQQGINERAITNIQKQAHVEGELVNKLNTMVQRADETYKMALEQNKQFGSNQVILVENVKTCETTVGRIQEQMNTQFEKFQSQIGHDVRNVQDFCKSSVDGNLQRFKDLVESLNQTYKLQMQSYQTNKQEVASMINTEIDKITKDVKEIQIMYVNQINSALDIFNQKTEQMRSSYENYISQIVEDNKKNGNVIAELEFNNKNAWEEFAKQYATSLEEAANNIQGWLSKQLQQVINSLAAYAEHYTNLTQDVTQINQFVDQKIGKQLELINNVNNKTTQYIDNVKSMIASQQEQLKFVQRNTDQSIIEVQQNRQDVARIEQNLNQTLHGSLQELEQEKQNFAQMSQRIEALVGQLQAEYNTMKASVQNDIGMMIQSTNRPQLGAQPVPKPEEENAPSFVSFSEFENVDQMVLNQVMILYKELIMRKINVKRMQLIKLKVGLYEVGGRKIPVVVQGQNLYVKVGQKHVAFVDYIYDFLAEA